MSIRNIMRGVCYGLIIFFVVYFVAISFGAGYWIQDLVGG
jgi:hypothetical protein